MKQTLTVRCIRTFLKYAPYIAIGFFVLAYVVDGATWLPSFASYLCALIAVSLGFLIALVAPATFFISVLPPQEMIIDQDTLRAVFKTSLHESVEMIPDIDLRVIRWKHKRLLKVRFDDHGVLMKEEGRWLSGKLSAFKDKMKKRGPYKTSAMLLRELRNFLGRQFRHDFHDEASVKLEAL